VKTGRFASFRRTARRFRRFARPGWRGDERGSAAIEFALIAPVFFFLMFVIAETALVFIAEQVLDNAVFETARLIRTGQTQSMSADDFREEVCNRAALFINCEGSDFYLEVVPATSFADLADKIDTSPIDEDDEDGGFNDPPAVDFGDAGGIMLVRVYYQWPTNQIFGSLSLKNLSNGKRLIGSFAAFCNEPYAPAGGTCGNT
jgi:Flp pilus assembly protein TadG